MILAKSFIFYLQVVAIILISVGTYSKAAAVIASLNIVGGIIACGVFLFLIAIVGFIGACRHAQVILFFVSFSH